MAVFSLKKSVHGYPFNRPPPPPCYFPLKNALIQHFLTHNILIRFTLIILYFQKKRCIGANTTAITSAITEAEHGSCKHQEERKLKRKKIWQKNDDIENAIERWIEKNSHTHTHTPKSWQFMFYPKKLARKFSIKYRLF